MAPSRGTAQRINYQCTQCGKMCKSENGLMRHIVARHPTFTGTSQFTHTVTSQENTENAPPPILPDCRIPMDSNPCRNNHSTTTPADSPHPSPDSSHYSPKTQRFPTVQHDQSPLNNASDTAEHSDKEIHEKEAQEMIDSDTRK